MTLHATIVDITAGRNGDRVFADLELRITSSVTGGTCNTVERLEQTQKLSEIRNYLVEIAEMEIVGDTGPMTTALNDNGIVYEFDFVQQIILSTYLIGFLDGIMIEELSN